jgi:putative membrane protein insertion efficiency factor
MTDSLSHFAPSPGRRLVQAGLRLPAAFILLLIRLYQRTLSPALPVLTLGGCVCRFSPTCSHYAADAIRTHGALRGTWLAASRLAKCTPLHPGGFDPVPARGHRARPVCRSAA